MENIDAEQLLLENNLDGEVNQEETEDLQYQSEQCTEPTTALSQGLERNASALTPSEATRTLSDYLLTQIMQGLDHEKYKEMTHKLPYESQLYIQANIGIMKEKFAEFITKYATQGSETKTITEGDVKNFFQELNKERVESLKYHIENQKEKK